MEKCLTLAKKHQNLGDNLVGLAFCPLNLTQNNTFYALFFRSFLLLKQHRFITGRNCPYIPVHVFGSFSSVSFHKISNNILVLVCGTHIVADPDPDPPSRNKRKASHCVEKPGRNYPQIGPIYKNSLDWTSSQKNSCSVRFEYAAKLLAPWQLCPVLLYNWILEGHCIKHTIHQQRSKYCCKHTGYLLNKISG